MAGDEGHSCRQEHNLDEVGRRQERRWLARAKGAAEAKLRTEACYEVFENGLAAGREAAR